MLNNLRGWHIGPCGFQDPIALMGCTWNEKEWVTPCERRSWEACNQLASGCSGAGSKQDAGRLQPLGITCHVLSSSPAASVGKIHKIQRNPQYSSKPANQWFHLSFILLLGAWVLCCTPRSVGVQLHTSPGSHLCNTRFSGLVRDTSFDIPHLQSVVPTLGRSPIQQSRWSWLETRA